MIQLQPQSRLPSGCQALLEAGYNITGSTSAAANTADPHRTLPHEPTYNHLALTDSSLFVKGRLQLQAEHLNNIKLDFPLKIQMAITQKVTTITLDPAEGFRASNERLSRQPHKSEHQPSRWCVTAPNEGEWLANRWATF